MEYFLSHLSILEVVRNVVYFNVLRLLQVALLVLAFMSKGKKRKYYML
jgi:hypothetical protein